MSKLAMRLFSVDNNRVVVDNCVSFGNTNYSMLLDTGAEVPVVNSIKLRNELLGNRDNVVFRRKVSIRGFGGNGTNSIVVKVKDWKIESRIDGLPPIKFKDTLFLIPDNLSDYMIGKYDVVIPLVMFRYLGVDFRLNGWRNCYVDIYYNNASDLVERNVKFIDREGKEDAVSRVVNTQLIENTESR